MVIAEQARFQIFAFREMCQVFDRGEDGIPTLIEHGLQDHKTGQDRGGDPTAGHDPSESSTIGVGRDDDLGYAHTAGDLRNGSAPPA